MSLEGWENSQLVEVHDKEPEHDLVVDWIVPYESQAEAPTLEPASPDQEDHEHLWDDYQPLPNVGNQRSRVAPEAHELMISKLTQWQKANDANSLERPHFNAWYLNLRITLIKRGLLTKQHSLDVCRSFIKSFIAKH